MAPKVVLVSGMAGSGKTRFIENALEHLTKKGQKVFILNLDPAVIFTGYESNLDIRDIVDYKKLQEGGLGCNGAITASLLLFVCVIDQVMAILSKTECDYILVDTPGQIESLVMSSFGGILVDVLKSLFETGIVFVIDGSRCHDPQVAIANQMYSTSLLYRHRIPIVNFYNRQTFTDIPLIKDTNAHNHFLLGLQELLSEFDAQTIENTFNFL